MEEKQVLDLGKNQVVLVDESDREIGLMSKLEAHEKGLLHRACSVFIFNSKGKLLLQKRADIKYHSAGLWTNTCCSHPNVSTSILNFTEQRLKEEMGLHVDLSFLFSFQYKAELENGLIENELDHVFWGVCDQNPILNPEEASDFTWISIDELVLRIHEFPEGFTSWLKIIMKDYLEELKKCINRIVPKTKKI
jgi:isopentenyl-diphosphate Delta-isomerase